MAPRGTRVAAWAWALLSGACSVDDVVGQLASAPMADAAAAPDAAVSACPGTLFCADFEQGLAGYDVQETNGALSLGAAGSGNALRADISQGSGSAFVRTQIDGAGLSTLYLRSRLWVPSSAVLDDVSIFYLGPSGGVQGINVDLQDQDRFELFLAEPQLSIFSEPQAFQRDTWHCLQLVATIAQTTGALSLSVDGQQVAQGMDLDTQGDLEVTAFLLGIQWSSADQDSTHVLLDDVVLSGEPVECP